MSIAEKLTAVAENVPKVYEAGKKSEYESFWDIYQNEGKSMNYSQAFAYDRFTEENYKPKYDIVCDNTTNSGRQIFFENKNITDVKVAVYASNNMANCFGRTNIVTIPKLVITPNTTFVSDFLECYSLKNLTVEGTIGKKGFDLHYSPLLSKESIISVMNALSSTTSGLTVIFNTNAVDAAFRKKLSNLLTQPYIDTTKAENGITFTVNADGSITINGTATAQTIFNIAAGVPLEVSTQYEISGVPAGLEFGSCVLQVMDNINIYAWQDFGGGLNFTTPDKTYAGTETFIGDVFISIASGTMFENLVIKPFLGQAIKGSDTDEWKTLRNTKANWTISLMSN